MVRQVKRLLPVSPADRRRVGEFVFRQPTVIKPDTSLLDCLNVFQTKKTHMAFVTKQSAEFESYIGKCTAASHSAPTAASTSTSVSHLLFEASFITCDDLSFHASVQLHDAWMLHQRRFPLSVDSKAAFAQRLCGYTR